jgi:uroporphyrinogen decarboxylase
MSSLMLDALHRRPTHRRPVWIMRQAGRYLPEYRALRQRYSFEQLCASPELAAEVTMQPIRRFPLDAAIIFADLMSPLASLGVGFRFDPGPVIDEPLRTREQIERIEVPPAEETAPEVFETLRIVRRELDDDKALLGFAGAPLSLAAYLIEGQGSKSSFPEVRALLAGAPDVFGTLMERLAELSARYLGEQVRAGADAVQVFDTWAGLFDRRTWSTHVRPHLLRLLERVGETGAPRILYVNDAPHLIADYAALPCEAIACDWREDLASVREITGGRKAVQGNIDPAVLIAEPDVVRRATAALLAEVPAQGHVVNLGHGILPNARIESVQALIETVHQESAAR